MPQVDFYVLDSDSPKARWEFVARLLGKLQSLGKTAHIAVNTDAEAEQLNSLLWAYPPESFLPHQMAADAADPPREDFLISAFPDSPVTHDVYINLRHQPPPGHAHLDRLVEVVVQETTVLAATRENFRFYRQQGYPIQSHSIRSA